MLKLHERLTSRLIGAAALSLFAIPGAALAYNTAAATTAANGASCTSSRPFYWEIGTASSGTTPLVSGSVEVTGHTGPATYIRTSTMTIASASKWIVGTYAVERYAGVPPTNIVKGLNMKTGYNDFDPTACVLTTTVHNCFVASGNDTHDAGADNIFFYSGGNAQYLADTSTLLNLGSKTKAQLLTEFNTYLNLDASVTYAFPALAGGMNSDAAGYAHFLQRLMKTPATGGYVMNGYLSYFPVATYPCPVGEPGCTPMGSLAYHYSLHHWIEDSGGDGAFSSLGAQGFYPWISADKAYYGVLARKSTSGNSLICGQAIRTAFFT